MRRTGHLWGLFLIGILTLAVVASGCISGETTQTMTQEQKEVLEVYHWWTAGGEKEAFDALAKKFQEKYPNIEVLANPVAGGGGVNLKMILQSLMLAGKPPDTFQVHAGYEMAPYVQGGMISPIDDIWTDDMKQNYPDTIEQMVIFSGHYYAVPINVHRANVIWYNKAIFDKYGIDPASIKTIDDLFAVAEKLKQNGVTPFALGDRNKWPATQVFEVLLVAVGGIDYYEKFINGEITENDPTLRKVLEYFVKYVEYSNSDHAAKTWDEACAMVYKGEAAMTLMGDWANGYFKANGWTPNADYGAIAIPANTYDLVIDTFVLPTKAAHPEAAKKWLSFIGTAEAQNTFNPIKGSIPPRIDAPLDPYDPIQRTFMKELRSQSTKLYPSIAHGSAAPEAFAASLNDIISELATTKDIDSAMSKIISAIQNDLIPNKIKEWDLS
ncbi:MAG TPA: carbohydrate ABC transporter substrate-binding protein [Thermococcus litoralis]|uniref:Carbohydrate ABC transporter substrate-binding protein n=1 Tax=Thermococcus litoralis TaxID=2265 RepID=A0A7C5P059_THELI|nr:carbohydrate ABC transporter substrate-binding protein [Thermococcus litoralis]